MARLEYKERLEKLGRLEKLEMGAFLDLTEIMARQVSFRVFWVSL